MGLSLEHTGHGLHLPWVVFTNWITSIVFPCYTKWPCSFKSFSLRANSPWLREIRMPSAIFFLTSLLWWIHASRIVTWPDTVLTHVHHPMLICMEDFQVHMYPFSVFRLIASSSKLQDSLFCVISIWKHHTVVVKQDRPKQPLGHTGKKRGATMGLSLERTGHGLKLPWIDFTNWIIIKVHGAILEVWE